MKPNTLMLLLLCLLPAASCRFPAEQKKTDYHEDVAPEIKAAFLYRAGSVWYYRDSATGEHLTFRIDTVTHGREFIETTDSYQDLEKYYCYGLLRPYPFAGPDSMSFQFQLRGRSLLGDYHDSRSGSPYHSHTLYWLSLPKGFYGNYGSTYDYLSTMTVGGKTYNEVYHSSFTIYGDEFWLTKTDGVIKMHLQNPDKASPDRHYELDSCRIVR